MAASRMPPGGLVRWIFLLCSAVCMAIGILALPDQRYAVVMMWLGLGLSLFGDSLNMPHYLERLAQRQPLDLGLPMLRPGVILSATGLLLMLAGLIGRLLG